MNGIPIGKVTAILKGGGVFPVEMSGMGLLPTIEFQSISV
jgi:hypothetical protein